MPTAPPATPTTLWRTRSNAPLIFWPVALIFEPAVEVVRSNADTRPPALRVLRSNPEREDCAPWSPRRNPAELARIST